MMWCYSSCCGYPDLDGSNFDDGHSRSCFDYRVDGELPLLRNGRDLEPTLRLLQLGGGEGSMCKGWEPWVALMVYQYRPRSLPAY
jgi:hypothetical protein